MKNLKKIIKNNTAKIAIFGMGYVGIPLARTFTNAGFEVTGIDIDSSRVKTLKLGISPINHITDIDIASMLNNGFAATDDYSIIKKMDILILCVPTPLSKNREPDLSYIIDAANNGSLFEIFGSGTAVVVLPILGFGYENNKYELPIKENSWANLLKNKLNNIQYNVSKDPYGWTIEV